MTQTERRRAGLELFYGAELNDFLVIKWGSTVAHNCHAQYKMHRTIKGWIADIYSKAWNYKAKCTSKDYIAQLRKSAINSKVPRTIYKTATNSKVPRTIYKSATNSKVPSRSDYVASVKGCGLRNDYMNVVNTERCIVTFVEHPCQKVLIFVIIVDIVGKFISVVMRILPWLHYQFFNEIWSLNMLSML